MKKLILLNSTIGNNDDLTPRVKHALENGSQFAVEDTRWFKEFCKRLGINVENKVIKSLHDQSSEAEVKSVFKLLNNNDLYVVSEAGSPIISDPAFPLIRMAIENQIEVVSYSGVSSFIHALEVSGLPPYPVSFHGFFPRESGKRKELVQSLGKGSHFFFESPRRIKSAITDLCEVYRGDIFVGKELSKTFESVYRFSSDDLRSIEKIDERGEFVFAIYKSESNSALNKDVNKIAQEILEKGSKPKLISKLLASILGKDSKEIYDKLAR